jgi:hypothetical protein
MAFVNGDGQHVNLVMSAPYKNADLIPKTLDDLKETIGSSHDAAYEWQEAAFFGNLFSQPPAAFYCRGQAMVDNYLTTQIIINIDSRTGQRIYRAYDDARMCAGSITTTCPFVKAGNCSGTGAVCTNSNGTMTSCTAGGKTYAQPMTTWVLPQ